MDFTFSEDQVLLREAVRDFLRAEVTPEWIRARWESGTGHDPEFWSRLAEVGVPGLLIPEVHDGLGLDEVDAVGLLEEVGRVGLAAPVVSTAVVAAPLLRDAGDVALAAEWLPRIAAGRSLVAVADPTSPLVADAHVADLLLAWRDDALIAVPGERLVCTPQPANDPSRRLSTVEWDAGAAREIARSDRARELAAGALDRGAFACAAEQLGVCDRLIAMSVDYASQRRQFGVPIGSFQAVKHMLANVKVKLEYARSLVERAAWSVARATPTRSADVSMAKIAASEAALAGARTALQVHGAIGYTWEQDLHIWMRRAWSLDLAWGTGAFHSARLADAVVDGSLPVAAFGYEPPDRRA